MKDRQWAMIKFIKLDFTGVNPEVTTRLLNTIVKKKNKTTTTTTTTTMVKNVVG